MLLAALPLRPETHGPAMVPLQNVAMNHRHDWGCAENAALMSAAFGHCASMRTMLMSARGAVGALMAGDDA